MIASKKRKDLQSFKGTQGRQTAKGFALMTPKQKKQRIANLKMCKSLGYPDSVSKYSDSHLRQLIERKKNEVLNALGVDTNNGRSKQAT
jgi:hypothetical protein